MASLVLVSHSALLARGARELAEQAAQGRVRVHAVGGLDDHTLGTNPDRILEALEAADDPAGVLVLVDLGSAVLSAELALELLSPKQRARTLLCDAPLVEGAVAAASQLAAGASVQEAAAEARRALDAKVAQLGGAHAVHAGPPLPAARSEVVVTVHGAQGIHARPAALFVRTAAGFDAEITARNLSRGSPSARAASVSAVALLDARQGDHLALSATGPEAAEALEALRALVAGGFGEAVRAEPPEPEPAPVSAPPPLSARSAAMRTGVAAAPGVAVGPAVVLRRSAVAVDMEPAGDAEVELQRLGWARERARDELRDLRRRTAARLDAEHAAIFDTHLAFLEDPALLVPVERRVRHHAQSAAAAWQREAEALAARYAASDSPVLQSRAVDVRDLCARVLGHLHGRPSAPPPPLEAPSILLLAELTPSEAAALDPRRTLAVCMARGGPTAHSVILARRLGVPTVVALGDALLDIVDGSLLAVDGDSGEVVIAPDGALQAAYAVRELAGRERRTAAHAARALPATTRDGHRVHVLANVASLGDAHAALDQGAEGIGLLRTELLYLARDRPPSEDEQVAAYRAFFDALGPRPVVVRTFDIGGDKPARYLDVPAEPNPALGRRGLRLALEHPALLSAQLRAVLRAAEGRAARLMFPMVTTPDELRRARALLVHASAELRAAGLPQADQVACGVMIEVPAAALLAGALAPLADFFSIGTNDLAQFTLAADRTNARTVELADSLHPAVLMLVERAVQAAHAHGKPVAMCGELAGDPQAVPILLGLGVDELSANAASVPGVKAAIREVSLDKARALARRALQQESAAAVRSLLR